jgi:hypothetical protein
MAEHGFDGGRRQILGRAPGEAPSKTSETAKTVERAVFEVFEGSVPGRIPKIEGAMEDSNLGKYPIGGAIKNIKKMAEPDPSRDLTDALTEVRLRAQAGRVPSGALRSQFGWPNPRVG